MNTTTGTDSIALSSANETRHVSYRDWENLAQASDPTTFLGSWLAIIANTIDSVHLASVLLPNGGGDFRPSGNWPSSDCELPEQILTLAREAANQREALIEQGARSSPSDPLHIAYPLTLDEGVAAIVVMEIGPRDEPALDGVLEQLQIASAWIELWFRREQSGADQELVSQAISTLSILNRISSQADPVDAANELATSLASELHCERVIYGVYRRTDIDVLALSNSGQFGRKMNVMRLSAQAMLEAVDQDQVINFSVHGVSADAVVRRHQLLAEDTWGGSILTVPISRNGRRLGAVLLERSEDQPFSAEESALVETLASIAGGVIEDKRESRRSLPGLVLGRFGQFLSNTLRLRHPWRTAAVLGLIGLVMAAWLIERPFDVRAQARLEGVSERAVVAPFDGYIDNAQKRVGDRVEGGEVLGQMDTTEFELELVDLSSRKAQILNQIRESQAGGNRAQVNILLAQSDQTDAQIAQLEARIRRTELVAPYTGTIVRGDLSRQLGGAVTRGEVLFEVAPLDAYRVALQVDERDISFIQKGAAATLVLASRTGETIDLIIDRITPVALAEAGSNTFRVEAIVDDPEGTLRSGMEGIARIRSRERSLLWIWTRDFTDWLRLAIWRWLP